MKTLPSNEVKDLLRQRRRRDAMKLYREQRARGPDFSFLHGADHLANHQDIPLDEAIEVVRRASRNHPGAPPVRSSSSSQVVAWSLVITSIAAACGGVVLAIALYQDPNNTLTSDSLASGLALLGPNVALFLLSAWAIRHGQTAIAAVCATLAWVVTAFWCLVAFYIPVWTDAYPLPAWFTREHAYGNLAAGLYGVALVLGSLAFMLLVMDRLNNPRPSAPPRVKCPACGYKNVATSRVCRYCEKVFDEPDGTEKDLAE